MQQVTGAAASSSGLRAHSAASAVTLANGVQLAADSATTYTKGAMRYVAATLKVRNAQTDGTAYAAASHNLTLVAAETASSIDQTAVSRVKLFDGSNAPASIATALLPAEGPMPGQQSLQVFSEAEVAAMTPAAGVTSLLPYGFVVANANDPTTRSLPGSPAAGDYEGTVTVAVAFPTQTPATANPFSVSLVLQAVDDSNLRVTQGADTAAALGSHDVAVLGQQVANTNDGHPICTVRTAGTAAAPTAYLVNDANGPNLASLPSNQVIGMRPAFNATFCQDRTASSIYTQFVVDGSEGGGRETAGGTYGGNRTQVLTYQPGRVYFTGESVSITLTSDLTGGAPYVAQDTVDGAVASSGAFTSTDFVAAGSAGPSGTAIADFDGDGKPDLAVAFSGVLVVYPGDGSGVFGGPQEYGVPGITSVAAGDMNGDGHPDLVATVGNSVEVWLWGSGSFTLATTYTNIGGTNPGSLKLADFDGDGNLDAVMANPGSNNATVLWGDGTGGFSGRYIFAPGGATGESAVAVGDFGNSFAPDVAIANATSNNVTIELYNGNRTFTLGSVVAVGTDPVDITTLDIDGDGNVDFATADGSANSYSVGWGNGAGATTSVTTVSLGSGTNPDAALSLAASGGQRYVLVEEGGAGSLVELRYNGSHTFVVHSTVAMGAGPQSGAVADVTGDRHPDAVVVDSTGQWTTLFGDLNGDLLKHTPPAFTAVAPSTSTSTTNGFGGAAVAAFDNDEGKLDAAIADGPGNVVDLFLGDGNGDLTASGTAAVGTNPDLVVAAGFEGDGPVDLAVANLGSHNITLLHNGNGTFTATSSVNLVSPANALAVGDFNGDGLPDIAASLQNGGLAILLNEGSLNFSATTTSGSGIGGGIATTDVNDDGKLDLAVGSSTGGSVTIYDGNGTGGFTAAGTYPVGGVADGLVTGDFNGDGLPDFATGDATGGVSELIARPGGGYTRTVIPDGGTGAVSLAAGDVNGDGVADVVALGVTSGVRTLFGGPSGLSLSSAVTATPLQAREVLLGDFTNSHQLSALLVTATSASIVPQRS